MELRFTPRSGDPDHSDTDSHRRQMALAEWEGARGPRRDILFIGESSWDSHLSLPYWHNLTSTCSTPERQWFFLSIINCCNIWMVHWSLNFNKRKDQLATFEKWNQFSSEMISLEIQKRWKIVSSEWWSDWNTMELREKKEAVQLTPPDDEIYPTNGTSYTLKVFLGLEGQMFAEFWIQIGDTMVHRWLVTICETRQSSELLTLFSVGHARSLRNWWCIWNWCHYQWSYLSAKLKSSVLELTFAQVHPHLLVDLGRDIYFANSQSS